MVRQLLALLAAVELLAARQAGVWVLREHKALQVETPAVETSTPVPAVAVALAVPALTSSAQVVWVTAAPVV